MTTPNDNPRVNLDGTIPFLNRKLKRSRTNKVLFGVLGGIGETYNIDPNVLRILFLVSLFFPGPQILIYIAATILMWNT